MGRHRGSPTLKGDWSAGIPPGGTMAVMHGPYGCCSFFVECP